MITLIESYVEPLTKMTVKALDLKPVIDMQPNKLTLKLNAGYACAAFRETLVPLIKKTFKTMYPSHAIEVSLNFMIKPHQTQMPGLSLKGVKNVIAVGSGKGGVGKSTMAVNLALALKQQGANVGLLDADIYGPSLPMMLGGALVPEPEAQQINPVHIQGLQVMSMGYLADLQQAMIWRGPMLAKSLLQMINQTAWDNLDFLIVDLPPGTGDIQLTLIQKIPLAGAVVVSTPQNIATLDAEKAIQLFDKTHVETIGLIENMAYYECPNCGHHDSIFGQGGVMKTCEAYQKRLLGQLPLNARVREGGDNALPFVNEPTFNASAQMNLIALKFGRILSQRPLNYAEKFPFKVE